MVPLSDNGRKPKLLSMGDLLLDLIVRYDPQSGEADTGPEAVQIWPGGSAANFAVQAARSGAEVRFVGRVGRDWAGDMLTHSMESEGVLCSVNVSDTDATGRVLVMLDPQGHRRMWSYPGTSAGISPADLDPAWFENLDAMHITGYSLLRDGPRDAALEAVRLAKGAGSTICTLDPNPPHLISDFGPARFREMIAALEFDVIFPNLEEGALLAGLSAPDEIARDLLEISPLVALTLGEDGCLIARQGEQELLLCPALLPDRVADVTGAGDAFAAGFVIEYLESRDPRRAADVANRLASGVVSRMGAR